MKITVGIFAVLLAVSFAALGQQAAPAGRDALLDHMTGAWTLQGTLAGHETTHDVEAEWVLNHEYVRLHETSREKNAQGQPAYEAIVFLEWDEARSQYNCLWLDSTSGGGLSAQGIAHGKRNGDEILFLFKGADGSNFYTTFVYDKSSDTWRWVMDGEAHGKRTPFGRVKLTRK
ncbi:MAG: hypothetical protein WAM58_14800 [Candidatus Acidiferrum sp.]